MHVTFPSFHGQNGNDTGKQGWNGFFFVLWVVSLESFVQQQFSYDFQIRSQSCFKVPTGRSKDTFGGF